MKSLILNAYEVLESQLVDAPLWIETTRYDIAATIGNPQITSWRALKPLVQDPLAQRFGLIVH